MDDETAVTRGLDAIHQRYSTTIGLQRDALSRVWHELVERHFPRFLAGEISMGEQRRARMRDLFGVGDALDDRRCDEAFAVYLEAYEDGWTLYDDVGKTLDQLGDGPLGVITNGDSEQQRKKLERTGLAPRFSVVVTSGEYGFAKPDRRIAAEACRRAGVHPSRAVFVGDDWTKDIVGSRKAGLQPIWLRREGAPEQTSPGIPVITTLHNLSTVLLELPSR